MSDLPVDAMTPERRARPTASGRHPGVSAVLTAGLVGCAMWLAGCGPTEPELPYFESRLDALVRAHEGRTVRLLDAGAPASAARIVVPCGLTESEIAGAIGVEWSGASSFVGNGGCGTSERQPVLIAFVDHRVTAWAEINRIEDGTNVYFVGVRESEVIDGTTTWSVQHRVEGSWELSYSPQRR